MKHYTHKADAALGAVLLLSGIVCTAIILATVGYQVTCRIAYPEEAQPYLWPSYLPYLAMLAAIIITRRQLFMHNVHLWAYMMLASSTILGLWFSFIWFQDPMHDIALSFGSHGRWGCTAMKEDGSHVYLIRDDTVPWMLFAPVALATVAHWIWSKRRRSTEPAPEAAAS